MEYTTQRGITIDVTPIPLLLEEIRRAHQPPARLTYTEHMAGGGTQEVEITEAMAATWAKDNPDGWAEHAEKWAEYERIRDANQERLNDAIWTAVKLRAVSVELPADDDWIADQALMDLEVPTGKVERRLHYIQTEVIGGMRDIIRLTAIANGADIDEGAIALAEASFRGSLQRSLTAGLAGQ